MLDTQLYGRSLMNAERSLKLARSFIGLPVEKRRLFLEGLRAERIDFSQFPIVAGVEADDRYALSYAQQRMWFLWQLDPHSGAYNLPAAVRLSGTLNRRALEAAFASLVARHETLRTVFVQLPDDSLRQVPCEQPLVIGYGDLSVLPVEQREAEVAREAEAQAQQPFDLANGPLLRVRVLYLGEHEHVLLLTLHHIVSDGWSMSVLIDEFCRSYDAHDQAVEPRLAALPVQYSDYALWQRRWLEAGEQQRQLDYWLAQLGDEHPVLELPTDSPRPVQPTHHGRRHALTLDAQLVEQVRALARQQGVTLFMLLLGAFNIVLHRHSSQKDLRVGVPIANRNRNEIEGLIGFFVNTQVLRVRLDGMTTVAELLAEIKAAAMGAQDHQDLPFECLVDALKLERSLSYNPLFQVMYNHQPEVADVTRLKVGNGLELSVIEWESRTTQFDLSLDTYEQGGRLNAAFTYASDLFTAPTIERMALHWLRVLQAMVANPAQRIGEIALLDADDQRQLVEGWGRNEARYPNDLCVHELFQVQVAQAPQATALIFEDQHLSYGQLNGRVNRLARTLIERGVGPEVLVGIALERGLDMVVGLLAVLKASGGYVPLDPQYPADRLQCMIEDSASRLVLTQTSLLQRLPLPAGVQTLCLDQDEAWISSDESDLANRALADNLAYVMFTSGSTGRPKGVGISHRALARHAHVSLDFFGLSATDRVLQFATFNFDGFVEQLYPALVCGASVVIRGSEIWDSETLYRQMIEQRISVMDLTTAYWHMLAKEFAAAGPRDYGVLRQVHGGGEAMPPEGLLAWREAGLGHVRLLNTYGPTEATVTATTLDCHAYVQGTRPIPLTLPIGKVLPGRNILVLDDNGLPAPVGVAGELVIGGELLARGYFQRPGLSAERFIPDPYSGIGARLYRTGDLARFNAEGVIEYVGRIDHQVKIRGFRIELGEIEARLLAHKEVADALVLALPGANGLQLVGYVVPTVRELIDADRAAQAVLRDVIRGALQEGLPDYMVPAHLLLLGAFPLSPNGKLDRKALPRPDASQLRNEHVAPRDALEQRIAAIWQAVLKREQVGVTDNFFELGGDSIMSIQVVSRARQAGLLFSPKDLFQHQTVQGLASVARQGDVRLVIDQGTVSGPVGLLPIQCDFFAQDIPAREHWNQALLLQARQVLQADVLAAALAHVLSHHDVLRSCFVEQAQGWQARIAEPGAQQADLLWVHEDVSPEQLIELNTQAQASLDLADGPLLRAVLATLEDGSQRLLLAIHHLVVDGVSWRILLEDLQQAYSRLLLGQPAQLPAKTSSVTAWIECLHTYAQAPALQAELDYWTAQLSGAQMQLPCDNPQGSRQSRYRQVVRGRLDRQATRQLLQQAPAAYRTQVNDLLLTALARTLRGWTGHADTVIQLEGHGREDLFDGIDLSRSIGWFTSLFPIRLTACDDLAASIKGIKEQLRAVPTKGLGFGVLRYLGAPAVRETLAALPQPRVTFNYLGQFDGSFDADALLVPASESAGAELSDEAPLGNWLEVEGQVYDGELEMRWTFSREQFAPVTVEQLAARFGEQLLSLVGHCCEDGAQGVTPSDFPLATIDQAQLNALEVCAGEIEDLYPLSPMQQGMLFHSLLEQGTGEYINQLCMDVDGLDVDRFQNAWQAAMDSHDILRSAFSWESGGQQLQIIHRHVPLDFTGHDWRGRVELVAALQALAEEDRARGFELQRPGLLRLTLIHTGEDRHHLMFTNHHILMDGWSSSQLLGEVMQRYHGQVPERPTGRYRDYIQWLQAREMDSSERFWKERLAEFETPTLLARVGAEPDSGSGYALLQHSFDNAMTQRLGRFARQQKVTLNTLVQAAWLLLLQRYTGQDCVTVGTTVAGRPADLPGVESQLGLFINTLPLVASPRPHHTVAQWLQGVQALNLAMREHEHSALFEVQGWAGRSGEALFDNILVFENFPVSEALQQGVSEGLRFGPARHSDLTSYPLTLGVTLSDNLALHYSFDQAHFSAERIRRINEHMSQLLAALCQDAQRALGELPMLAAAEQQLIVEQWNATATATDAYPLDSCIHTLIEAHAARTPDAVALVFGERRLSYRELDRQSNQLAHQLIEQGVGPDVLVGIAVERSIEMVLGLVAVLKAGGAYVPLDPEYPRERLAYLFADSGIALLLSQSHLLEQLPVPETVRTLNLDAQGHLAYPEQPTGVLPAPENLAYVIYTSGSTGQPKGAGNRHRALTNRLCWMQQAYALQASDTVLQKTPFSFDVSVWEFFWPLMTGARLVLAAPGDHRDPARLVALIDREQVSTLHFVPSMLQVFLQDEGVSRCTSLTRIVCSGEALQVDAQRQVFAKLPNAGLYNLYGPTEAAIDVTHWTCRDEGLDSVPIGQPIANLSTFVLSHDLSPVPAGVVGELYLGGEGLARGYHRRPGLSAERFVASPFGAGQRLYRTGDLACQRADGVIEYRGRIDHQVKIRGLRIELGEIEARLLEQEEVREAAVLAVEMAGGLQLVAYLVPADKSLQEADADARQALRETLKARLKLHLPDFMVPNHVMLLEQLPLSPNGKLERKALPAPDASTAQRVYVAPRTELEVQIAQVWQDVLKLPQVGVTDNFFELGGDSIISIQVVSRARQLGIRFTPKELFQHQSVEALAKVARQGDEGLMIDQGPVSGAAPLLPFQQVFFETVEHERHHWNQSVLLKAERRLDPAYLEQVLQALVTHHDALRLSFGKHAGTWQALHRSIAEQCRQRLLETAKAAHADEVENLAEQAQRSLELAQGPLLKALLVDLDDGSQRLLIVIHHLVVDGVSWRVLFDDLQNAYSQLERGERIVLPSKTTAFKAWGERLQAYAREPARERELAYWQASLEGTANALPCERPSGSLQNRHGAGVRANLDKAFTRQLLQHAPAAYRTQINDLLLTALARVIGRWAATDAVLVQLEGHGREELFESIDLTRTVGWFTSLFPVRLSPCAQPGASIKRIKEQLRAVPDKGIGFGVLRYLGDAQARQTLQALPVPRITFNYLGQFDTSFDRSTGALLSPAGESAGSEQSPLAPLGNWLTLNSQVYGGELRVTWTYSREMFDEATVQGLADAYIAELQLLIAHCCEADTQGVTPSDFPLAELTQAWLDALPLPARQIENLYPLSPMQHGMLFHSVYESSAGQYINQMRLDVQGLEVERFRLAWQATVDAHDILRTAFLWEGELAQPLQLVQRQLKVPFRVLDWQGRDDLDQALAELADEEQQGFELSRAPLLRLTLVLTGEGRCHLLYTHHHILMDGWSNSQLMGEVLQRYHGQAVAQPGHYRDYIDWLQRQDGASNESFWRRQLAGLEQPTRLASAIGQASAEQGQGDHYLTLESSRLSEFAREQKVTVNTLLQAAWLLLLQRYTGQASLCFGATVSGRPADLKGVEQQIGLFINTLPVITAISPERLLGDWLQGLQAQNLALREHEHTPLFDVQRWSGHGNDALFDALLVFENYPISEALQGEESDELRFGALSTREQTSYPLTLSVGLGSNLALHFNYARAHFSDASIAMIGRHLQQLLAQLPGAAGKALGELQMLVDSERQWLLHESNALSLAYPGETCIHDQIGQQVRSTPDKVALIAGTEQVSYAELDARANRLAHRLIELGVGPEIRVGVAMVRSSDMLVALLAVLKAGGAYVPLDPDYPSDRVAYMLKNSRALVLLTEAELLPGLPSQACEHVLLIAADDQVLAGYPSDCPHSSVGADNLAYVIYTSGSTGLPKGVAIAHRNVAALIAWTRQVYSQDDLQGVLASTSICFDLSVWELLVSLACGGSIVLARNALQLPDLPCRDRVRLINTVPSAIAALLRAGQIPPGVRIINLAGEPLKQSVVEALYGQPGIEHVYDLYGPSEDTTYSTWTRRQAGAKANIGRPLHNTASYLLDTQLLAVPEGVAAELYLAGDGITRGYLLRPGLTAERFVPDPFAADGERMYRTGDLARYQPGGVLEYAGRIDHQVKIRGFRVELGEIEARLLALPGMREVAVVAVDGGSGQQLAAYLVPLEAPADLEAWRDGLRQALRAQLPEYMVPGYLIALPKLPLTPNGKLDRKALPAPDAAQMQKAYEAPSNALERTLADIWQQVLGLEQVGSSDNFFELGGDSIVSIQVVRMAAQAGVAFTPKQLFEQQSVRNLAALIAAEQAQAASTDAVDLQAQHDALAFWQRQYAAGVTVLGHASPASATWQRLIGLDNQALAQAARAYRCAPGELLLTALAHTLGGVLVRFTAASANDLFVIDRQGEGASFPLRLDVDGELGASVQQVKAQLRAVPDAGQGYVALQRSDDRAIGEAMAALACPTVAFSCGIATLTERFEGLAVQLDNEGDTMSITAHRVPCDEAWFAALVTRYQQALSDLLDACLAPGKCALVPADFPLARLSQADLDRLPVVADDIEDIYALSPMQEGMLFHSASDNESGLYINQVSLPIGGVDPQRLLAAWHFVSERHDILRSSFHWQGDLAKPFQVVHRQVELSMAEHDWRGQPDQELRLQTLAEQQLGLGFELGQAPLQRLVLVRLDEQRYQLIWTSHHILMDGWSQSRLFGEVLQHYGNGQVAGEVGRYRDFIAWLASQDQQALRGFWEQRLRQLDQPTSLSQAIHPRHVATESGHRALYSYWDARQTAQMQAWCRHQRITLNTLVQGAWLLVLQRFTGQRTVTFGATVAGRPQSLAGADNMLGLFINTLPVIQTLEPSQPLEQWLSQLQAYNLDIRDHAHAPLADIQRWSGQGGQGLFDSIIVFENYPIDERLNEESDTGLSFGQSSNHGVTSFPMDLAVMVGERLSIEYMYMLDAFSGLAVERIRHCMEVTLQAMLEGAGQALGNLQRLGASERRDLLAWSRAPEAAQQGQLLPELIRQQALERPQAIAVQCAGESLSYGELEARANRLAHALHAQGAGPEVVVGVAMPRSVDTLVAFLAVLKAGSAYVPLDIAYPPERLAYMMEDSAMALLIGHGPLSERLSAPAGVVRVALDRLDLAGYPSSAPLSQVGPDTLAYLVYTSGSTGRPKGVAVSQGPLSEHCQAIAKLYEMDSDTCELHFMSFAFDGAHERWLTTLASGGRLVIRDEELWTPEQTHRVLTEQAVTIACFPPAYLKQLADHVRDTGVAPAPVRIYCFGGDAVPEQTFERVKETLRPQYFTNGYGPTETVVTPVLWKTPASGPCEAVYAPIGRAVGERALYVLDDDLELLPRGLAGELYIGGRTLARGYYRQPSLTAERFVPDSHGAPGARVYRSGDLVRLRPSGVLDYVGRIDHQVKIRGFRIELGEIEASLRLQDGVRDALVVVREGPSGKQLIGYVVTDDGQDGSERLRAGLRLSLPEHMVPVQVISLIRFPVTPNGKLDRKALPEPHFEGAAYVAPNTDAERWMAQIWAQALQVEKVGITDNFFELGGDSILSLQVISRVRNHPELHMDLKLRDLMRYQTIKGLFEQKPATAERRGEDLTHLTRAGLFNLLPIQEWFFEQNMQEQHHYNQGLLLRARQPLDHDRLQQALGLMLQRHDALRLRFRQENGRWYQQYAAQDGMDPADCLLHYAAADDQEVAEFSDWAQRSLDLSSGPVMRVVHFVLANGESRLLLAIHHLVIDTVSWRILLQDLQQAYQALCAGSEVNLALRSSSYSAWVERLRGHVPSLVDSELDWWLQQLDRPSPDLPCDNPRGKDLVEHLVGLPVTLSQRCTAQLLKRVPVVYQTQINDVLLATLSRVLCRWSEQPSVLIQFEGHGREDVFDEVELSRTVGWFTSMYPIRLEPGVDADFGHSIQAVKAQLAALPNKGLGYGVLRHLAEPAVGERLQRLPQARVTFNYMGQFDQSFDEQALLVPAEQGAGQCYSSKAPLGNWLEIVGQVFEGQMTLRCLFSKRRYRPQTIEWLMAELKGELEALVAHCMEEALA